MIELKKKIFDVIILGSGIAGISLASRLSKKVSVCIIEKEKLISYHSTGRSFAFYVESYGNDIIRKLTKESKSFFLDNYINEEEKILKKRGVLFVGDNNQENSINNLYKELNDSKIKKLNKEETLKLNPCLKDYKINKSIYDNEASDIDVDRLYNIFLKDFKNNNGEIFTDTNIIEFIQNKDNWDLKTDNFNFSSKIIVNATGAWADEISKKVNATNIDLIPKKRTVFCFKPENIRINNEWPLTVDVDENFYFKAENGIILASPADETPTHPHDCLPDEIDIAIGIERIKNSTNFEFKNITNKWAGLRNFVKDKTPVIGFDKRLSNFFWLSGQGGYGIQTSPSLSQISANMILGESNEYYTDDCKINIDLMDIKRFN